MTIPKQEPDVDEEDYDENYTARPKKRSIKKNINKKKKTFSFSSTKKNVKGLTKRISKPSRKAMKEVEKFICVKCGEVFHSGWALGGHASRVHPGESESYRRKIERREERVMERQLLALAKQKHSELYGGDAPINRVKIRKFKKELKKTLFGNPNFNTKAL
jgi:hypothetical protein